MRSGPFCFGFCLCDPVPAIAFRLGGAVRQKLWRDKKDKGLQVFDLQAFMIGAQERTRTSTPLSAST